MSQGHTGVRCITVDIIACFAVLQGSNLALLPNHPRSFEKNEEKGPGHPALPRFYRQRNRQQCSLCAFGIIVVCKTTALAHFNSFLSVLQGASFGPLILSLNVSAVDETFFTSISAQWFHDLLVFSQIYRL